MLAHLHRLPTWAELAAVPEAELRQCLLGFRARYIAETAQFIARHPGWLEATEHAPYATAKERLLELPGVGEKVADCVLLFGAGRLEAFPVDTWVLKSLARRYHLVGWKPAHVAHFRADPFRLSAGATAAVPVRLGTEARRPLIGLKPESLTPVGGRRFPHREVDRWCGNR